MGTTVEALEATMERHALDEPPVPATIVVDPAPAEEPRKPSRGQQRFSQLTSERDQEKHLREQAEAKARDLEAQLAAARRPAESQPGTPKPAAAVADKFTFPAFDAYLTTHPDATYDDWTDAKMDAHSDWKLSTLDLDAAIRTRIEADQASRAVQQHVSASAARAKTVYPDFDAVISGPHMQAPWPVEKLQAIRDLPEPEHIQYALGKNPDLAERLRQEPNPYVFGMELAKLIPAPRVAALASTPTTGSVNVPAPYQPVGSGRSTTVPPSADLAKRGHDFDASGYRERRAAERGVTRRR